VIYQLKIIEDVLSLKTAYFITDSFDLSAENNRRCSKFKNSILNE
jgi:hypothetical protein